MTDLTCGCCGGPGRLTLAREADSLIWKGEQLMHAGCGTMGEPADVFEVPVPRPGTQAVPADWLQQSIDDEWALRRVLEDL